MLFVEFRRFMNKLNAKNTLLHNRYILYAIFLISVLDLFYMVIQRDYYTALVFIFTGILTSFFSKNMIIILSISLVVSYLLKNNANLEGFEEGIVDTADTSNLLEIDTSNTPDEANANNNEDTTEPTSSDAVAGENPAEKETDIPLQKLSDEKSVIVTEVKKDRKKQKSKPKTNGANANIKNAELGTDGEMGSEEIKSIINEQNQLIEKLDKYEPFMNTIQNIAKKFGFSDEEEAAE